jgi:hypothetical protein
MLATVLKSRRATEATFAIIETFAIAWRRGFQPRQKCTITKVYSAFPVTHSGDCTLHEEQ